MGSWWKGCQWKSDSVQSENELGVGKEIVIRERKGGSAEGGVLLHAFRVLGKTQKVWITPWLFEITNLFDYSSLKKCNIDILTVQVSKGCSVNRYLYLRIGCGLKRNFCWLARE